MDILIYSLIVFIIICLILIWIISTYNKFQSFIIRINESEASIDTTLRKRFDLLNKSIGIIEENTKEKNVLEIIGKIRSKKLSNFDLDRQLYDAINEYTRYKEKYNDLKNNTDFLKIDIELNETESEIVALRKYYNDIITDYNKLAKSFPSNLVRIMCKYKKKPYFDGKNMDDDITVVEDDPKCVLPALFPQDTPSALLLHLFFNIIGNGDNLCRRICMADDKLIGDGGADSRQVQRHHVAGLFGLVDGGLDTLFKIAAVLGAGQHAGEIKGEYTLAL